MLAYCCYYFSAENPFACCFFGVVVVKCTATWVNSVYGIGCGAVCRIGYGLIKLTVIKAGKRTALIYDSGDCIGEGSIGVDTFQSIVNHPLLKDKPMILETPNELPGYAAEIKLLREIVC